MTLHPLAKRYITAGSLLLLFAVMNGAFGAHGLKNIVTPEKLVTFETGIRYHFYHAFGILFLGLLQQSVQNLNLKICFQSFLVGIILFSFNCYFYAVTEMKIFAMIVPFGGVMFLVGWLMLFLRVLKFR